MLMPTPDLTRWRRFAALLRWLFVSGSLLLVLCYLTTPVHAQVLHAQYDHSDPASNARLPSGHPPHLVEIWFTEQIEPAFSSIQVYNRQRQRVDLNDSHGVPTNPYELVVSLRPHLPDGAYTVVFSNVSAEDGHHVQSNFSFVVGTGPLPTDTSALLTDITTPDENFNLWSVTWRWLNYLGMAGLVGCGVFLLFVGQPTLQDSGQELATSKLHAAYRRLTGRASQVMGGSLLVLLIDWIAFLLYQAGIDNNLPVQALFSSSAVGLTLFHSRFGQLWLIRLGLLAVALLSWRGWARRCATGSGPDKAANRWLLAPASARHRSDTYHLAERARCGQQRVLAAGPN